ncbi:FAD:protein FMN transferase [Aeromicrobium sp. CTD01-1L150]|uniref:FAD:protein FMN transferase n=1 Tax=Aeromicrobium sp. CTD01-1L150 TaxID=3341830 RepID=UPI0035BF90A1
MPRPEAPSAAGTETLWQFEAIGTWWEIDTDAPVSDDTRARVLLRIEDVERTWSRFRGDSVVSRAAREGGAWTLDATADRLLSFYSELYDVSGGAVNPLVGRTLSDLGYDADYSLQPSDDVATVPPWDVIDWRPPVLSLREPVLIDVGAAGKGFLVDLVAAEVAAEHRYFAVDASGDVLHRGEWPVRIALQDPRDQAKAVGIVEIGSGRALGASAVDRRAWGDGLHHVLDGRTGEPTGDVVATWVVARDAMLADGLATALFFVEPEVVTERWDVEWAVMRHDGSVRWSRDLAVEMFT